MIEFTTITIICILLLLYFRPGKMPPLNRPLIIHRVGQYHATLAPQLNLAQPLIEAITKQLGTGRDAAPNCAILCFEVHDRQVVTRKQAFYLLTIIQHNGMLYFQAVAPGVALDDLAKTAAAELTGVSAASPDSAAMDERIAQAVANVALQRRIAIKRLLNSGEAR